MASPNLQGWLDDYIEAWRTYDPKRIGRLFSENATYTYYPWKEPVQGRGAIVESWLSNQDLEGSWEASYRPWAAFDNKAVAVGETRYSDGKYFLNIWQLTFDSDGACSEFVEWYMNPPELQG